jgi:FAD:protein FMN transferase
MTCGVFPSQAHPLLIKGMRTAMGTFVTITVASPDRESARNGMRLAFQEIERVAGLMSVHKADSEISRLNSCGFLADASPDTRAVIQRAVHFSVLSAGAFDTTILPVLKLWESGAKQEAVPTEEELKRTLELVGSRKISVQGCRVSFARQGMGITLAGIAKGYAVDRAIEVLSENHIKHALVNGGGDIRALGGKTDDLPWEIGVLDPRGKTGCLIRMPLIDKAVATSGAYRRPFNDLLDARSGKPARELTSTTIVTDRAMDADVLATAFHVLGPADGVDLLRKVGGGQAFYVTKDGDFRQERIERSSGS